MGNSTVAFLPMLQIKAFERRVAKMPEDMADQVLIETAEAILSEAQFNAPVKSGHLSESHTVSEPENGFVILGVNTPYAMAVHETHPTKSKWFIEAINRNFRRISKASIMKALRERGAK